MPPKRPLSPSPPPTASSPETYTSSPITDRSSRFLAIFSPSLGAQQLQSTPSLSTAMHRITASRLPSTQRSLTSSGKPLYTTTHSDGGEKYGGKAAASVLSDLNVEGSIVVARWFGGVMLGPVRFEHIKNVAREAISQYTNSAEQQTSRAKKARTIILEEEEKRKNELIRVLPERDQSISVLRGLLAEKQITEPTSSQNGGTATSPVKVPEYSKLPLKTLENLERARDATIGWILAQIEKAEQSQIEKAKTAEEEKVEMALLEKAEKAQIEKAEESQVEKAETTQIGKTDMAQGEEAQTAQKEKVETAQKEVHDAG
ncbi:MAG: hypothetical protein Q9169_008196 [Polycauliona sp. 2 TL-2023]